MFEELKKKSVKNSVGLLITFLVIGVVIIALDFKNFCAVLKSPVEFDEMTTEEIINRGSTQINAVIDLNFGTFMEEYSKNTKTGATKTTDYYYIILNYDENDPRYMAVKLPPSYKKSMEKLEDYTYEGTEADPIEIKGTLTKMSGDELEYFKECFIDYNGYTEEEYAAETIPYIIDEKDDVDIIMNKVLTAVAIGCILIGIITFVMALMGVKLKKIKKQIAQSGYTESTIENDYAAAGYSLVGNEFKIGKLASYNAQDSKPYMLLNKDMVWAYQMTTTHRTNGIKTGTTYSLYIWDTNKKNHQINMAESAVQDAMRYINKHMPWVVLGYSDDLKKQYNRDYNGFLNLAYNTCPHDFVESEPQDQWSQSTTENH